MMKTLRYQQLTFVLGLSLLLVACGSEPATSDDDTTMVTDSSETSESAQAIKVGDRIFSVPSPAQMAILLKGLGLKYDKSITTDPAAGTTRTTKEGKAMLMGMYGADLAYAVAFQDAQGSITLFKAVEGMSAELGLENAVDKSLVTRFQANMGSEDSLLVLSGEAFREADRYLKENDRHEVAALVLAGGWVQTLHIATTMYSKEKDQKLADRIGEQRSSLNNLIGLLDATKGIEKVGDAAAGLRSLKNTFDAIKIEYNYEEPATDVANKTTYINSRSKVVLDDATLAAITQQVSAIRKLILS